MSALSPQKQTCAAQEPMSALPPIATAKADSRKRSCLLYPRKRTCAVATAHVRFGPIADMDLVDLAPHSPSPRGQVNAAVSFYRKIGAYALTQCATPILGKRYTVARRWRLAAKEWRPVIIKVAESRGNVDWPNCHIIEIGIAKQSGQQFRMAYGKSSAFIERSGICVQSN